MDNDVYGTDYCIGFSTCVTRTIELTHRLRTSAGSHERFLVIEVFGRYAGFTALLPTMAGAADRCLIPEYPADMEQLAELLTADHNRNPSKYSVVLVSEGAQLKTHSGMSFENEETDMFGHRKLGGIGDKVAAALKEFSPKYNNGRRIDVVNQRLGYLVRSGDPDALDSIVPMAFGNLALDLILKKAVRPARERSSRILRQRSDHERDVGEESRGREALLQHRAAATRLRIRRRAALHHDERLISALRRHSQFFAASGVCDFLSRETVCAAELLGSRDSEHSRWNYLHAGKKSRDPLLLHLRRIEVHLLCRTAAVDGECDIACADKNAGIDELGYSETGDRKPGDLRVWISFCRRIAVFHAEHLADRILCPDRIGHCQSESAMSQDYHRGGISGISSGHRVEIHARPDGGHSAVRLGRIEHHLVLAFDFAEPGVERGIG